MLKLNSITYDSRDLIQLIKNNTALIIGCPPGELFVNLRNKNGKTIAEVVRADGGEILIENFDL